MAKQRHAKQRHLENAPITEAIIDLRVKLPPDFDINSFASLKEELNERFPGRQDRRGFVGGFGIKAGVPLTEALKDLGIDGYLLSSSNKEKIVQFRKDGFTFNRLRPYTNWADVLGEAKGLWPLYVDRASDLIITRIAVRYINRIEIPLPVGDLSRYLTAPPKLPDNIPQDCRSFFSKIVMHDTPRSIDANIIQSMECDDKSQLAVIMIDIDVYKRVQLDADADEVWPVFGQLRDLKNDIFFGSITERTAKKFE